MKKKTKIWFYPLIIMGVILIGFSSCKKEEPPVAAFTGNQTSITAGGSITFTDQSANTPTSWSWNFGDGGTSTIQNPSYTYSTAGTYTVSLTVTNNYGSDTEAKTNYITVNTGSVSTITDIDGNVYHAVTIGTQVWMVENLKTTKYNNGTSIPLVTDQTAWSNLSTPAYCWYNNDNSTYGSVYGALYNWHTVNTGNLCPTGWHVPSDVEWQILTDFLGGDSIAGGKLKETGTLHWNSPNTGATNETGFTALPGGYRYYDATFNVVGYYGNWWSSSGDSTASAFGRNMSYNTNIIVRFIGGSLSNGYSVRCVRDF